MAKQCSWCFCEDLFYDPIMNNWICENCNKVLEYDELITDEN